MSIDTLAVTRLLLERLIALSEKQVLGSAYLDGDGIDLVIRQDDGGILALLAVDIDESGDCEVRCHPRFGAQMGSAWLKAAIEAQPLGSAVREALTRSVADGTLITAVGGVDKKTGNVVISRVNVP